MARTPQTRRPAPVWALLGVALLAHFALLAWFKHQRAADGEMLWFSHAGLLLGGLALLLRSCTLACGAFVLVAGFHALWLVDAAVGLTTGSFPVGGTRYLLTADRATLALTAHHIYLAPVLACFLVTHRRAPFAGFLLAVALLAGCTAASRLALPAWMNINFAHSAFPESAHPLLVWGNALPTPWYLAVHTAFCTLVFLLPSAIIMNTITAARRAPAPRHNAERAQAARVIARLGRGRAFTLIELIAVLVVLAILSGVALPRYFDYSERAKESADRASVAAINTALNDLFLLHRVEEPDPDAWITAASEVASAMDGDELPNGITLVGGQFQDQRGNLYDFVAETADAAARLQQVAGGDDDDDDEDAPPSFS